MPIIKAFRRMFRRKPLQPTIQEAYAMGLRFVFGQLDTRVQGNDAIYEQAVTITDELGTPVHTGTATARVNNGREDKAQLAEEQLDLRAKEIMAQAAADLALSTDSSGIRDGLVARHPVAEEL